jgi:hypothetical protein
MLMTKRTAAAVLAAAVTMLAPAAAAAQLASPSVAALGMGDSYTAAARGYAAVAWNPAGLALSGNPGFSMTLLTPRGVGGFGPVTLAELARWEGEVVPLDVRQRWLAEIQAAGRQAGTGGFDASWIGVQVGPVALQASSSARAVSDLSPGIAQLIMLGNVDADGVARDISLTGSALNVNAFSTVAASVALPLPLAPGTRLAVGVTASYTVGHFLALGDQSAGQATANPLALQLSFPLVHSPTEDDRTGDGGRGFGLDLGVGYEMGPLNLAATVQNLVNTFAWDTDLLRYRPASMSFSAAESFDARFEERPLAEAPAGILSRVDDLTFRPSLNVGAMLRQGTALTLTADARAGSAAGLASRAASHVGAGAEYRVGGFLPLRAGAAWLQQGEDNSGFQVSAGVGLRLGSWNAAVSYARRSMSLGPEDLFMATLLSFGL